MQTPLVALPDFRNLGVWLRVLLLAQGLRLCWLVLSYPADETWGALWLEQSVHFDPPLLLALLLLALLQPQLARLPYRWGLLAVVLLAAVVAAVWRWTVTDALGLALPGSTLHSASTALLLAAALLFYFDWRQQRLSPALAQARLVALQARIRPHFLFNSLNSVLALLRERPQQAEAVLQDLADLYRAILSDARSLVPLAQELALARAYIEIETVRLGPQRLRMHWHLERAPQQALVPPLLLQPLLENAVRYGVEPSPDGADITLEAYVQEHELRLWVRNTCARTLQPSAPASSGAGMALSNIRERLQLHYDSEAQLRLQRYPGAFQVHLRLPIRRNRARARLDASKAG